LRCLQFCNETRLAMESPLPVAHRMDRRYRSARPNRAYSASFGRARTRRIRIQSGTLEEFPLKIRISINILDTLNGLTRLSHNPFPIRTRLSNRASRTQSLGSTERLRGSVPLGA